nr:MAG TPA: hypothetical protein [Caudoviricetes sp.]
MISRTTIAELKGVQLNEELNERNYIHMVINLVNDYTDYINPYVNRTSLYVFFNPVTKKSAAVFKFDKAADDNNTSTTFSVYFPKKLIIIANERKYTIDIAKMLKSNPKYNCVYANYYDAKHKNHNVVTDHVDGKTTNKGYDLFPARLVNTGADYSYVPNYYKFNFNVPGVNRLNIKPKNPNDGARNMRGVVVYLDVVE